MSGRANSVDHVAAQGLQGIGHRSGEQRAGLAAIAGDDNRAGREFRGEGGGVPSGEGRRERLPHDAAEAGDATAALAMGATYDPIVLAKLGARAVGADVEKARIWYQKAEAFGSTEAPRRIEMLANR